MRLREQWRVRLEIVRVEELSAVRSDQAAGRHPEEMFGIRLAYEMQPFASATTTPSDACWRTAVNRSMSWACVARFRLADFFIRGVSTSGSRRERPVFSKS